MTIHHITAIAGDPQRNLDFYSGILGLRLVKVTVNFDDPGSYHLYYGDEIGRPGTLLTFFPWPAGERGRQGTGQIASIALAIPPASLGFWLERLLSHGLRYQGPTRRFSEQVLALNDPDGLPLELVTSSAVGELPVWAEGPVPGEHAIRGIHGATIWEEGDPGTAELLTQSLGFETADEDAGLRRLGSPDGPPGGTVYLRSAGGFWRGAGGVGTIHHMAFRAATDQAQLEKRAEIEQRGLGITPVINRQYFHSVYFREPGGVLFEIATDGPGFTIDEPPSELGTHLQLPPMYQVSRASIEQMLPPLRLPHAAVGHQR